MASSNVHIVKRWLYPMIENWKKIESYDYSNALECVNDLTKKGYVVSLWIDDVAQRLKYNPQDYKYPVSLARLSVESLGFTKPTTLQSIYDAFLQHNLSCVPPHIAIYTRLIYDEQPTGEWLRIAVPMSSMVDSDGVPHLPKLGRALGRYFIETYWAYSGAIFHPKNEFVVMRTG